MKVHFCCDMDGWVLERTARVLMKHIPGSTIGEDVSATADANVYFPYYRLRGKGPSIDAALFTHREVGDGDGSSMKRALWDAAVGVADICLAMSNKTALLLPEDRTVTVELPSDPALRLDRPVRFGVCGRNYASGRKRLDWVERLAGIPGTEWVVTDGSAPWGDMGAFYGLIDYLVIVSENEGGPLPLKEAMACGKPVIAPDVGWAWDYPVIRYCGYEGLLSVIRALTPRDRAWEAARGLYSVLWHAAHREAA